MRNNRYLLFCLAFLCLGFVQLHAQQNTTVRFKILNQKNEPVSFSTVDVISVPDTVHVQQKVSDSLGLVSFQLVQSHPYRVKISSVNHKLFEKNITVKGDNPLF